MSLTNAASIARRRLALIAEVTRGTTPSTPAYDVIPAGEGAFFNNGRTFERSSIIRSDRMGGQQVGGVKSASGAIPMPVVKELAFRQLLESALSGAWGSYVAGAAAISSTFSGSTLTRAAGDFTADALANRFKVGDKVALDGTASQGGQLNGAVNSSITTLTLDSTSMFPSATAAAPQAVKVENEWITYTGKTSTTLTGCTRGAFDTTAASHSDNVAVAPVKKISTITSTTLVFDTAVVTEATPVDTTITSKRKRLIAGTTRKFFTVEQYFGDLDTPAYEVYTGQEVNTAQFTVPTSGEVQATFNLVGIGFSSSQVSSSTYVDTVGNKAMGASVTATRLLVDGSAISGCMATLQINVNNNRAAKYGVGSETACLIEEGDFDAEVSYTLYFSDTTERDKFINGTRFQLEVELRDQEDGHGYAFILPELVYTAGPKGADGRTITHQFTAFAEYDATYGTKMVIEEFTNN